MVSIVLGAALGNIADTMKENREYLKEKKSMLQERMVMSGLENRACLLYTSPSPRDGLLSRMPSSA